MTEKLATSVSVEEPEKGQKIFAIEIPPEIFEKEMAKEYRRLAGKVKVPGFRKGKAPQHILEARYKDAVRSEALERLISKTTWDTLSEKEVRPFFDPEIEGLEANDGEPIRFRVVVDEWPDAKIDTYSDFDFKRTVRDIDEKDLEREIEGLQHANVDFVEVNRPAIRGDKVKVDYQRYVDEAPFGKRTTDVEIMLDAPPGSDVVPLKMTEGLIGVEPDQTKSISIDFPEDHVARSLAGKTVEFRVEVKELHEKALPVVDDEFASKITGGTKNLDELKDLIREELGRRNAHEADRQLNETILEKLLEANPVEVPERLVNRVTEQSMPEFIPEDEIPEDKREEAAKQRATIREQQKKGSLRTIQKLAILTEISKREDLEPSDREVEAACRAYLSHSGRGKTPEEQREEADRIRSDMRRAIREEKVLEWVKEHSTVSEG